MALRKSRFRPMGLGDILDEAFDLYKNNFVLLAGIGALVFFPMNFISGMMNNPANAFSKMNQGSMPGSYQPNDPSLAYLATFGIIFILFMIAYPITMCAFSYAISQRYIGATTSIGKSYKFVLGRLGAVLLTSFLVGLIYCGIGVAITPGIIIITLLGSAGALIAIPLILGALVAVAYLIARVAFCFAALVVEGVSGTNALTRSWRLSAGHGWRVIGIFIIMSFITGIISLILQSGVVGILLLPIGQGNEITRNLIAGTVYGIIGVLMAPVMTIVSVLLYYDLRIRKEGFDLQMLASNLAARTGTAAELLQQNSAAFGQAQYQTPMQQPVCTYCRYPISNMEDGVMCPSCRAVLHRSCWNQRGGCTTSGCPASPEQNTPTQ